MSRSKAGHTVLEMLFASAVMGLFMLIVGHAVVVAYRSHMTSTTKASEFRSATLGMDRLGRELRMCQQLYVPDPVGWPFNAPYLAEKGTSAPFIFRRFDYRTGQDVVVGYHYDPVERQLQRLVYNPDFDPGNLGSNAPIEPPRKLAYSVVNLEFTRLDPADNFGVNMVQARMELSPVVFPLDLQVKVKGL